MGSRKRKKAAAAAEKEERAIAQAGNENQAAVERRNSIRQARVAQAQLESQAAGSGVSGSSSVQGVAGNISGKSADISSRLSEGLQHAEAQSNAAQNTADAQAKVQQGNQILGTAIKLGAAYFTGGASLFASGGKQ